MKLEVVIGKVQGLAEDTSTGTMEQMEGALDSTLDELNRRDGALEALITATCSNIDKLMAELAAMRACEAGGCNAQQGPQVNIPKLNEFKSSQVAKDMHNSFNVWTTTS